MIRFSRIQTRAAILAGGLFMALSFQAQAADESLSAKQLLTLIQSQQKQLNQLKAALERAQVQADAAASDAKKAEKVVSSSGFLDSVKVGGVVEIEATNTETFAGADSSDLTLATVEVFLDAKPHDFVSTHVQLLYEDDGNENITLDEAFVTLGNTDKFPLFVQAGRWNLPFGGEFDTAMSTDPLTLSLGESKESSVLAGVTFSGLTFQSYLFNGDTQKSGGSDTGEGGTGNNSHTATLKLAVDF